MTPACPEGYADSARIEDIDFEGMIKEATDKANNLWDTIESVVKGREIPAFKDFSALYPEDLHKARTAYFNHSVIQDLHKANIKFFFDFKETFGSSRSEYIKKTANSVCTPLAFLKDGNWYEKGQMGWFGFSQDQLSEEEWSLFIKAQLDQLDPKTFLTAIDCHI